MIMAPALVAGRINLDELMAKTKPAVDRTALELGLPSYFQRCAAS